MRKMTLLLCGSLHPGNNAMKYLGDFQHSPPGQHQLCLIRPFIHSTTSTLCRSTPVFQWWFPFHNNHRYSMRPSPAESLHRRFQIIVIEALVWWRHTAYMLVISTAQWQKCHCHTNKKSRSQRSVMDSSEYFLNWYQSISEVSGQHWNATWVLCLSLFKLLMLT